MSRDDLSDEEWWIVELPTKRTRKSRPSHDTRRFFNGMLHFLRVGCSWRDMHERYGKWNSIYVRSGTGPSKVSETRFWKRSSNWRLTDDSAHMIDSTTVRCHSQTVGAKEGLIRRLLVDHAVALRPKSTPAQTVRDALWLCSDRWRDFGLHRRSRPFGHAGQQTQINSGRQGLRQRVIREELLIHGIKPVIQPPLIHSNFYNDEVFAGQRNE